MSSHLLVTPEAELLDSNEATRQAASFSRFRAQGSKGRKTLTPTGGLLPALCLK
jgi:hypothetical protein